MNFHFKPLMTAPHFFHTVTLSQPDRHRLWTYRAGILLIVIVGVALVARQLLFPVAHFHFRAVVDSLANTISRPFETARGTAFDVGTAGTFTVARLTFTLPKDVPPLPATTTVTLHRTYAAFLAPIAPTHYTPDITTVLACDDTYIAIAADGTPHALTGKAAADSYLFAQRIASDGSDPRCVMGNSDTHPRGFDAGTLIASADGVFVTEDATMYPFQDTLSFDAMGYHFDNVITTTASERSLHKKARRLDLGGTHPSGTLFFTTDTANMYTVRDNMLYKIPVDAVAKKHAVTVAEASRDTMATCTLQRSLFAPRSYRCTLPLTDIATFPGNIFRFTINAPSVTIDSARVTLTTAITTDSLRYRLRTVKNELQNAYAQHN